MYILLGLLFLIKKNTAPSHFYERERERAFKSKLEKSPHHRCIEFLNLLCFYNTLIKAISYKQLYLLRFYFNNIVSKSEVATT